MQFEKVLQYQKPSNNYNRRHTMFEHVKDYYPTPDKLIRKMLDKLDFKQISSILEPSAGDGRLVEAIIEKFKYSQSYYYSKEAVWDIDLVEINSDLQHILKGKGHRVVADDYLTYNTYKASRLYHS